MFTYIPAAILAIATVAAAVIVFKSRALYIPATPMFGAASKPTAQSTKHHWLIGIGGETSGRNFHVGQHSITIGRSPGNKIQLTSHDTSRSHSRLSAGPDGTLMITDMKSNNGTFVNGKRVQTRALKDGDEVQIGGARFIYCFEGNYPAVELLRERKDIGAHIAQPTGVASREGVKGIIAQALTANDEDFVAAAAQLGLDPKMLQGLAHKYDIV